MSTPVESEPVEKPNSAISKSLQSYEKLVEQLEEKANPPVSVDETFVPSGTTKRQLVADIQKFCSLAKKDAPLNLMAKKKDELVQILSELMGEPIPIGPNDSKKPAGGLVSTQSTHEAAKALLGLNRLIASFTESASMGPFNTTGYVIQGYAAGLDNNEKLLLDAYAEIYRRHSTELNRYMGAAQIIWAVNLTVAASCVQKASFKKSDRNGMYTAERESESKNSN